VRSYFALTAVTVNWGRGYRPGEFKRNVQRVLKFTEDREHVVLFVQELDEEPDPAHEHAVFNSMLEPGTNKVFWRSREPIILSPSFEVNRRRRVQTMGSGKDIRGPVGTGPARYAVTCVGELYGIKLGFGNTHPHRRMPEYPRVTLARSIGEDIFSESLQSVRDSNGGISGIWGADMNDTLVPKMVPGEKEAVHRGLDHMRFWNHPKGAHIEVRDKGTLNGTIDPHDPLWTRFIVERRAA
jgi:hypothetical protein